MKSMRVKSETGSTHVMVIIILILAILGVISYLFWTNFIAQHSSSAVVRASNSPKPSPSPIKKSEIIELTNSDMNKYINYEQGFEFLFPKNVYTTIGCSLSNTAFDSYGHIVSTKPYYAAVDGIAPMSVIEGPDSFIIAPKEVVIFSDQNSSTGSERYYKCEKQSNTIKIYSQYQTGVNSPWADEVASRGFEIVSASGKDDIVKFIKKTFSDPSAYIDSITSESSGQQNITYKHGSQYDTHGGFAYKLWYYPAVKKLVYMNLGQSIAFTYPDNSNNYYDDQVINSFKFSTD